VRGAAFLSSSTLTKHTLTSMMAMLEALLVVVCLAAQPMYTAAFAGVGLQVTGARTLARAAIPPLRMAKEVIAAVHQCL
jgi:hypothetical protein